MQAIVTQITYCIPSGAWSMQFNTPCGEIETILLTPFAAREFLRIWPHVTKEQGRETTYTIIQNPQLNRKP